MTGDNKMGVFENILDKLGFEVVHEDDPETDGPAKEAEAEVKPPKKAPKHITQDTQTETEKARAGKVTYHAKGDVYVVNPTRRSDAKIVCDEIRAGRTVVVDVDAMDTAETTRLFDFIQGSVYALDGVIRQVNENVIIVAPQGIDIQTNDAVADDTDGNYDYSYVDDDDEVDYEY